MSELSKNVNKFFKFSPKREIDDLIDQLVLSDHLRLVLNLFYVEKKDIDTIAEITGYSRGKIEADLKTIRHKMDYFMRKYKQ